MEKSEYPAWMDLDEIIGRMENGIAMMWCIHFAAAGTDISKRTVSAAILASIDTIDRFVSFDLPALMNRMREEEATRIDSTSG